MRRSASTVQARHCEKERAECQYIGWQKELVPVHWMTKGACASTRLPMQCFKTVQVSHSKTLYSESLVTFWWTFMFCQLSLPIHLGQPISVHSSSFFSSGHSLIPLSFVLCTESIPSFLFLHEFLLCRQLTDKVMLLQYDIWSTRYAQISVQIRMFMKRNWTHGADIQNRNNQHLVSVKWRGRNMPQNFQNIGSLNTAWLDSL